MNSQTHFLLSIFCCTKVISRKVTCLQSDKREFSYTSVWPLDLSFPWLSRSPVWQQFSKLSHILNVATASVPALLWVPVLIEIFCTPTENCEFSKFWFIFIFIFKPNHITYTYPRSVLHPSRMALFIWWNLPFVCADMCALVIMNMNDTKKRDIWTDPGYSGNCSLDTLHVLSIINTSVIRYFTEGVHWHWNISRF